MKEDVSNREHHILLLADVHIGPISKFEHQPKLILRGARHVCFRLSSLVHRRCFLVAVLNDHSSMCTWILFVHLIFGQGTVHCDAGVGIPEEGKTCVGGGGHAQIHGALVGAVSWRYEVWFPLPLRNAQMERKFGSAPLGQHKARSRGASTMANKHETVGWSHGALAVATEKSQYYVAS